MPELELAPFALPHQGFFRGDVLLAHVQVDERCDLRAEDLRLERLEQVIDRAHRVALEDVRFLLADRGEEDDRDVLRTFARLDQPRRLEAVHPWHLDVEQNEREIALE